MLYMAKKRPDSKRTQGIDRHTKPRLAFHLDARLLAALERYISETKPRPTTTAVVVLALEEYLEERGFWPSSASAEPETPTPAPEAEPAEAPRATSSQRKPRKKGPST